jgi:lipopolysaccharide/colanic/teichoic acid biosynthesis glycosyltransferase
MTRPLRFLDMAVVVASAPMVVLACAALAILVRVVDGPPCMFRQSRVGMNGVEFDLYKLRTMRTGGASGTLVTQAADARVTRLGHWLRRSKLDELPQLWNVFRGDMSVVGPRPEVPAFADELTLYPELLRVRPGITDIASIVFIDEEEIFAQATLRGTAFDVAYREHLRTKLALNLWFVREPTMARYLTILLLTLMAPVARAWASKRALRMAGRHEN